MQSKIHIDLQGEKDYSKVIKGTLIKLHYRHIPFKVFKDSGLPVTSHVHVTSTSPIDGNRRGRSIYFQPELLFKFESFESFANEIISSCLDDESIIIEEQVQFSLF